MYAQSVLSQHLSPDCRLASVLCCGFCLCREWVLKPLHFSAHALQVLNELFKEPDSIFNKRIEMRPEVYQFCKNKTKNLMKHFYGLDIDA